MKTTQLEEIVFQDRNKSYGSYDLRVKYRKNVIISYLFALLIITTLVGIPFVNAMSKKSTTVILDKDVVVVIDKFNDDIQPPPPPPPPPPAPIQTVKYNAPTVVDTVKIEPNIITNDEALSSDLNQPVPTTIEVSTEIDKSIPEPDKEFRVVEEPATFMGGDVNDFRKWVQKNLVYPSGAVDNGIEGKVIVQFAINKKGELMDIKMIRGVDPFLDEETIRVLTKSPKWIPGKQGGTPVKELFIIPVSFVLQNK